MSATVSLFRHQRFHVLSCSGGWDRITEEFPSDIGAEVDQAFGNVEHALQQADGKGWDQVYKTRMYVVLRDGMGFDEIASHVVRNLKKYCPKHGPLLTFVEIRGLYKEMRIEIEAEAHLG